MIIRSGASLPPLARSHASTIGSQVEPRVVSGLCQMPSQTRSNTGIYGDIPILIAVGENR
jgi:hypothetical protein